MSTGHSETYYWTSTISKLLFTIFMVTTSALVANTLPPTFDSDEVKIERIKTERLEMFMKKLHTMNDTTVRAVLDNIENIERAMHIKMEMPDEDKIADESDEHAAGTGSD